MISAQTLCVCREGKPLYTFPDHAVGLKELHVRFAMYFVSAALASAVLMLTSLAPGLAADAPNPAADAKAFQNYFLQKFPKLKPEEFVNGPYSMNEDLHRQWEEKEQFPPYEFSLEMGKEM